MPQISVYGKSYSLKSASSSVDLDEVAAYVDSKMRELGGSGKSKAATLDLAVLTALNIAQELMAIKQGRELDSKDMNSRLDRLVDSLDKELQHIKKKGSSGSR